MPAGESMQSVVKSNRSIMLDKSKHFRKYIRGYTKSPKPKYDFPKATSETLEKIRAKLKKEQKITKIKSVLVFVILSIITLALFLA